MNNYELTVVLPGGASSAKKKSINEKLDKLLKSLEGKIKKTEEWGKLDLAYKIGKEDSGLFIHFNLELNGMAAMNLKDKLHLESDIIRYLIVKNPKSK